jgi:hypothetical protein
LRERSVPCLVVVNEKQEERGKKRLRMKREITKRITSMPVVVSENRKRKKKD